MAISYVGSNTGAWAGAAVGNNTVSLTALTGGVSSTAAAGDLVIAVYATGSSADRTLNITDGTNAYILIGTEQYSNGTTYDTNLRVAYKYLSAADTSVTFGPTGNNQDAGAATVHVFRGVDSTTPIGNIAPATGTGTGRPTPAAVVSSNTSSFLFIVGAGSAITGAVYTASYLSGFRSVTSADTNDAMVGSGYVTGITGTYTPAQFTGGTTGTADSWAAYSIEIDAATTTGLIEETSTATETQTVVLTADGDRLEAGNFSDQYVAGILFDEARTEPVAFSDVASASSIQPTSITETSTLQEQSTQNTDLNVNSSESSTAGEQSNIQLETNASVSESQVYHDLHDTVSSTYITNSDREETSTANDSLNGGVIWDEDLTETYTPTDQVNANFIIDNQINEIESLQQFSENTLSTSGNITETVAGDSTQDIQLITFAVRVETILVDEQSINNIEIPTSITETSSLVESIVDTLSTNSEVSENVTGNENSQYTTDTSASVSEIGTSSEETDNTLITNVQSNNPASASDTGSVQLNAFVVIQEHIDDLHDDLGGSLGNENYVLEIADAMEEQDSTTAYLVTRIEIIDLTESSDYNPEVAASIEEQSAPSEEINSSLITNTQITERHSATDQSLRTVVATATRTETVNSQSGQDVVIETLKTIIETINASDSNSSNMIGVVYQIEQLASDENSVGGFNQFVITDEQILLADETYTNTAELVSILEQLESGEYSENAVFAISTITESSLALDSSAAVMETFASLAEAGVALDRCGVFTLILLDYNILGRGAVIVDIPKTDISAMISPSQIKAQVEIIDPPRVLVEANVIEVKVDLE